ncbi:MAG: cyclic nucleotide-binding domain-containing protein [Nitrospirae bacterium]|nr:cyclic nucleotide-binding domain-containing protein [Nitrospirota bacterium]
MIKRISEKKLYFGSYLVGKRLISEEDMLDALKYQSAQIPSFIDVAIKRRYLDMKQVYEILTHQGHTDLTFEEVAVQSQCLSVQQAKEINSERERIRIPIGEILVHYKKLSRDVMLQELENFTKIKDKFQEVGEILKNVAMFQKLGQGALHELAEIADKVICMEGDRIISEGQDADCFYCVVSGTLKVTKNNPIHQGKEIFIYRISKNDVFGVSAIFEEEKRAANATAETETILLRFDREMFLDFLEKHSKAAYSILLFMIQRLTHRLNLTRSELVFERKHLIDAEHMDSLMDDII